jgi:Sec-independent protein translocase protein TatA
MLTYTQNVNLGTTELLIIVVLVIVVFGAGWLPKTARNLGRAKVEVERTQKQLADTKKQIVESTGLEKAEETMRKANRALNQSPKNLIKGAATGALVGKKPDAAGEPDPAAEAVPTAEAHADEDAAEDVDVKPLEVEDSETVNLDWSE